MTVLTTPDQRATRPAAGPATTRRRQRSSRARFVVLFLLCAGLLVALAPFVLVAMNAVKDPAQYSAGGPLAPPTGLHLHGIIDFWRRAHFTLKLLNSFVISLFTAVIAVVLSVTNAYAIGIGRTTGRGAFLAFFLIANLLPQEVLVYPLYYASKELDLYDTRTIVILIFAVLHSAFGTYLLSSVYADFPRELLDAAAVDGAGRLRTLWQIVVPVSRPTLAVLFTFFFIWTWNEFFLPLIFLISNDKQTVPIAVSLLQGQRMTDVTTTSAAGLLGIVPAVIFFLIFQRNISRGIFAGAVK